MVTAATAAAAAATTAGAAFVVTRLLGCCGPWSTRRLLAFQCSLVHDSDRSKRFEIRVRITLLVVRSYLSVSRLDYAFDGSTEP